MSEQKYIYSNGIFSKEDYELDSELKPNEVLVRPLRMLICASDLHHMRSQEGRPIVLGHEYVAKVIKVGDSATQSVGDLVTSTACLHCNECKQCNAGYTNYCSNSGWLGFENTGALSTLVKFQDHHLVKLPTDVSLKQASLFEVASIGYQAANLIKDMDSASDNSNEKEVLVMGAGPVGLFCALAGKKLGYKVTLLEKNSSRVKRATELGFDCLLLPEVLMSKDHHHKFNFIMDATGDVHGEGAFRYAPMLGDYRFKMVIVGKYLNDPKFEFSILNNMGASFTFMRGTPVSALQSVVDEWKEDIVKWEPHLITHEFDFDEVGKAYETTNDLSSTCKIMIKVQD